MDPRIVLPAITSILALVFAAALFDQWRERRGGFQLIWAFGMLFYGIGAGCEALAAIGGWNEILYRTWYLTGAVWTAGWLGLGTAFLLGRTRFGYSFALCLFLAGLFTFLPQQARIRRAPGRCRCSTSSSPGCWRWRSPSRPTSSNERWPMLAAGAVVGATALSLVPDGDDDPGRSRLRGRPGDRRAGGHPLPATAPAADAVPEHHRGVRADPRRRLLHLRVHAQAPGPGLLAGPNQPGDQFLFNLLIAPVAIAVNLVASLPGAARALLAGRLHSRVPATILIAVGAFVATLGDTLNRFGMTEWFQLGKFLGVLFLFVGFLVSIEVFREIRIPFTSVRLGGARHESA